MPGLPLLISRLEYPELAVGTFQGSFSSEWRVDVAMGISDSASLRDFLSDFVSCLDSSQNRAGETPA